MSWETSFEGLSDYYPGSSQKRTREDQLPTPPPQPEASWSDSPRIYSFNGVDYEFFSIGDLAMALGKSAVTIRAWESQGYIPTSLRGPSEHPSKRHRIYTRPQVEGLVRIAEQEGILGEARPRIGKTRFRELALDLFLQLAEQPLSGATSPEGTA